MDFLPKQCRICENGKYTLIEFNQEKASEYLKSIGRTIQSYESHHAFYKSAIYYATENNENLERFYDKNEYTCPHKDDCKFAKI